MDNIDQTNNVGASESDIQSHYDVGNEFYQLWLDQDMNYSCALWDNEDKDDSLEKAQSRKLSYHIECANAHGAERVLDIGCGWGALLFRLTQAHKVKRAVGLTLSKAQARWIQNHDCRGVEVYKEAWQDHHPPQPYNAIISIGAFEHFSHPDMDPGQKNEAYRAFFQKCASWLYPGSRLSVQTIAYGCVDEKKRQQISELSKPVFPGSELPLLQELVSAAEGILIIRQLVNHREHYRRTCKVWRENLYRHKRQAVALHGQRAGLQNYQATD